MKFSRRRFLQAAAFSAGVLGSHIYLPNTAAADLTLKFGEVQKHDDFPSGWTFFSYVPKSLDKDVGSGNKPMANILVTATGSNVDYNKTIDELAQLMLENINAAEATELIHMGIAIPRTEEVNTILFPPEVFDPGVPDNILEPDRPTINPHKKTTRCINLLRTSVCGYLPLECQSISKVLISGWGDSGVFGQRYSILNPEYVRAIAVGGLGGSYTMPLSELDGTALDWPVGVSNMEEIVRKPFDRNAYKDIIQMVGENKYDPYSLLLLGSGAGYSDEQIQFIRDKFGDQPPNIIESICSMLFNKGYDIDFIMYGGSDHSQSPAAASDAGTFLDGEAITWEDVMPSGDGNNDGVGGSGCFANSLWQLLQKDTAINRRNLFRSVYQTMRK